MEEVKEKKKTGVKKKSVKKNIDIDKENKIEEEKSVEEENKKNKKEKHQKEKKASSFNLIEVIIIMIITAIFGVFVGSWATYFSVEETYMDTPSAFDEFISVYNDIVDEFYGNLDEKALVEAGIKGMVDYLGDPYSSYLDYSDSASLDLSLEGEYVGMGATITVHEKGHVYISSMFENSPAEKAGFKVGDIIVAVGKENVTAQNAFEVSEKVKGVEGTSIDITILRDNEEMILTLVRGKVEIPSVSYFVVEKTKIGYIKIDVFARNTPAQFKKAVDEMVGLGIDSLIIDVRSNSGGYLTSAEQILSYFLEKDAVMYQLDTKGLVSKERNKKDKIYNLNLSILTNGYSASASEILAASLKDNLNAKVVGTKTYGKGTVQKAVKLSSGAMVKYTVQEWYTPNGNKINTVGVEPDYKVELSKEYVDDPSYATDNQLQKAIEILKK